MRRLRVRNNLSLADLAELIEVSASTLQRWEVAGTAPADVLLGLEVRSWVGPQPPNDLVLLLDRVRQSQEASWVDMANAMDVPSRTLRRWSAGEALPHRSRLGALAEHLELPITELQDAYQASADQRYARRRSIDPAT